MATKRIEYANGDAVGNFIFIQDDGFHIKANGAKTRKAIFRCECGKEVSKPIGYIKEGRMKSCGCKRDELLSKARTTHGMSNSSLMKRWDAMIGRCYRPTTKQFKDYGGRGISVCDEWRKFEPFYAWAITNGYSDELSIDRIDYDGNYEPSNCRWATRTTQQQNTRLLNSKNTSGYRGVTMGINKWIAQIDSFGKHKHLGSYDTKEEAALAYNKYVIENNLEHTLNIVAGGD